MIQGWKITGIAAVGVGGVLALNLWLGLDEEPVRMAVRATARTSFLLFLPVYLASSLNSLVPSARTPQGTGTSLESIVLVPGGVATVAKLYHSTQRPWLLVLVLA